MFRKELFIWLTVCVLRGRLPVCESASFPYVFEYLIVLVPDHRLSF